jgi:hypothetical protein
MATGPGENEASSLHVFLNAHNFDNNKDALGLFSHKFSFQNFLCNFSCQFFFHTQLPVILLMPKGRCVLTKPSPAQIVIGFHRYRTAKSFENFHDLSCLLCAVETKELLME